MKQIKTTIILLLLCVLPNLQAQTKQELTNDLKEVFQMSLYQSKVNIDKNDFLTRVDNNNNSFSYSLTDIAKVEYNFDGFHNVIITLKEGKKVNCTIGGSQSEIQINVFTFENQEYCNKAISLFEKIIHPE